MRAPAVSFFKRLDIKRLFVKSIAVSLCLLMASYAAAEKAAEGEYQTIEWIQLMPEDDLAALLNPPDALQGIADGSAQDNIDSLGELTEGDEPGKRFYEALKSTKIVETFANKAIRLPGFVVPLASDEEQRVTEFFIVPYFGACLHTPPPPPNQIVYVKMEKGFELESIYSPFWFEGTLKIAQTDHSLGSSAYSINLDKLYPYEE